jgi:hypothetical protein
MQLGHRTAEHPHRMPRGDDVRAMGEHPRRLAVHPFARLVGQQPFVGRRTHHQGADTGLEGLVAERPVDVDRAGGQPVEASLIVNDEAVEAGGGEIDTCHGDHYAAHPSIGQRAGDLQ